MTRFKTTFIFPFYLDYGTGFIAYILEALTTDGGTTKHALRATDATGLSSFVTLATHFSRPLQCNIRLIS